MCDRRTTHFENLSRVESVRQEFTDAPKYPEYEQESQRLSTFRTWGVQSPESLCKAGFFYTGISNHSYSYSLRVLVSVNFPVFN